MDTGTELPLKQADNSVAALSVRCTRETAEEPYGSHESSDGAGDAQWSSHNDQLIHMSPCPLPRLLFRDFSKLPHQPLPNNDRQIPQTTAPIC